ncbi:MAG: Hsp33 family molecular chaperone HslO [Methylococcales bacterium]|nr:Hsp33 family molecular chaperone HslO [Methylococcales bacterium]
MKEQDSFRRFLFEDFGVRGEWVRLEHSWQQAKQYQNLTVEVQEQLGQTMVAAVLLSATIKFDGSMIIQAQGSGKLKALVAQCTHDRKIRGLARSTSDLVAGSLLEMMGAGLLVITVEPEKGEPYQGIVALAGSELADAIRAYFLQSEQLQTHVWLFANETHAAGLFLQELPTEDSDAANWERISTLASTVTQDEVLTLDCEEILYRLFNEEHVRVFEPETVEFKCGCTRDKIETTLVSLGRTELESILQERETIEVDCEFCSKKYSFDKVDVENLLSVSPSTKLSETKH